MILMMMTIIISNNAGDDDEGSAHDNDNDTDNETGVIIDPASKQTESIRTNKETRLNKQDLVCLDAFPCLF